MRLGHRAVVIDVPHLVLLGLLAGFCAWYLGDSRAASTDVQNLLLIEPVALLSILFAVLLLPSAVTISPAFPPTRKPLPASMLRKVLGSMLMLGVLVALMPYAGFDVAVVVYVCGSLFVLGERRPLVLVLVPLIFGIVVTQLFRLVVPIHIPLLINLA